MLMAESKEFTCESEDGEKFTATVNMDHYEEFIKDMKAKGVSEIKDTETGEVTQI